MTCPGSPPDPRGPPTPLSADGSPQHSPVSLSTHRNAHNEGPPTTAATSDIPPKPPGTPQQPLRHPQPSQQLPAIPATWDNPRDNPQPPQQPPKPLPNPPHSLLDSSHGLDCRPTPARTHLGGAWGSPSCLGCPPAVPQSGWGPPWALGHPGPRRGGRPRPQPRLQPAAPSGSGPSVPSQKTPPGKRGGVRQHPGGPPQSIPPPNPVPEPHPCHLQVRGEHVLQLALLPSPTLFLLVPLS